MKVGSSTVVRRTTAALPAALLLLAAGLVPTRTPASVPVVRAPAQALAAVQSDTGATVVHHVAAVIGRPGATPVYGAVDAAVRGLGSEDVLRARFRVRNRGDQPARLTPLLEVRAPGGAFAAVPVKAEPDAAWHVRREWVRAPGGTVVGPAAARLAPDSLLMHDGSAEADGRRSSSANPLPPLVLRPRTSTEVELTVGLGAAAAPATSYELRLTDEGRPLGEDALVVRTADDLDGALTPGQRQGSTTGASRPAPVQYALTFQPALYRPAAATTAVGAAADVHGPYSATPDQCATCHRTHTATGPNLLTKAAPQASLCFTCHDGTGASTDVRSEYDGVPADVLADRAYYRHDALAPSSHTLARTEELRGVLDRHSECADCHNPHQAGAADATQTTQGWTASGRLAGVSGVAVTNGAAGDPPAYTFLDGTATPLSFEYQLCLKCHSGYTVLPSNDGFSPSRYVLDKGVELNPANGSYHPVEAPGTNGTAKMQANLAGSSPYKLWNLSVTSTVRCTQCHARDAVRSSAPSGGGNLPAHTSTNRGILVAPYRDRVLSTAVQPYAAADFALCLTCHGEVSYATETATGTNFFYHGKHLTRLAGMGAGGTDIDVAGAGQGNAICAECHFRIHSPQSMLGTESLTGSRLVSFAPDVTGLSSDRPRPAWAKIGPTTGSCALTCHGFPHEDESY
jgi:predicted CXXCH cytochrome family protein